MTQETRAYWDAQAPAFDQDADHGLLDPGVRSAWRRLLVDHLPPAPARIIDLGCGTGSVSVLLAEVGYQVHGVDLSSKMIDAAQAKAAAAGVEAEFHQGDVDRPDCGAGEFDVVFARHVLWAMPDADAALARWVELVAPGGRVVLVEGRWDTGGGIAADECRALLERHRRQVALQLLPDPALWRRTITDERYLVSSIA